jgi:hypothetical protein
MTEFIIPGRCATKGSARSFIDPRSGRKIWKADNQSLRSWTTTAKKAAMGCLRASSVMGRADYVPLQHARPRPSHLQITQHPASVEGAIPMRNMSFMLTTEQIRNRTKTVTRRVGWTFLKPGDLIRAVERCQGLKKGEKMQPLGVLRVTSVSRERLDRLESESFYGQQECVAEGFPRLSPMEFVAMFCATHTVPDNRAWGLPKRRRQPFPMMPCDEVTRIEFSYVDAADPL